MGCGHPTAIPTMLVGMGRLPTVPSMTSTVQTKKPVKSPGQGSHLLHQRFGGRLVPQDHPLLKKENQKAACTLGNATLTSHYFSAPFTFSPFLIRLIGQQPLYSDRWRHSTCSLSPSPPLQLHQTFPPCLPPASCVAPGIGHEHWSQDNRQAGQQHR